MAVSYLRPEKKQSGGAYRASTYYSRLNLDLRMKRVNQIIEGVFGNWNSQVVTKINGGERREGLGAQA